MSYGYNFFFGDGGDVLTFPITPAELNIKVGSKNKVVTLINGEDINILKSPGLMEIEFEARFPMRQYPYSRWKNSDFERDGVSRLWNTNPKFEDFYDKIKSLKEKRKPFQFIVTRSTPNGNRTWDTDISVALEDFEIKESADEGDDVLVSFKLRQWKPYGVVTVATQAKANDTTSTANTPRVSTNQVTEPEPYTVKPNDTLYAIAKLKYGDGKLYTKIYNANKTAIEADAKKHGKQSSKEGHWIWEGLTLTIPPK